MVFDLSALFGGKPWFKSVTAWGLVVLVGVTSALGAMSDAQLLSPEKVATYSAWAQNIGMVMTALGLRRAATAPNAIA